MGQCVAKEQLQQQKIQRIQIQVTRLKHEITLKMQKIAKQALQEQKVLVNQFKKQAPFRSLTAEKSIANDITIKRNKIIVFKIDLEQILKIIQYKHHLNNLQRAKQILYPEFRVILYSQSFLKDPSITAFCRQIKRKYPEISQANDNQIQCQPMKHHKKSQQPTQPMINQYLLNLINQQQLNLQEINSIGHKIHFGQQ